MTETPPPVGEQLAVINVKLDLLIATQKDHEPRLRKLEQFKWVAVGVACAGGFVGGNLAPLLNQ